MARLRRFPNDIDAINEAIGKQHKVSFAAQDEWPQFDMPYELQYRIFKYLVWNPFFRQPKIIELGRNFLRIIDICNLRDDVTPTYISNCIEVVPEVFTNLRSLYTQAAAHSLCEKSNLIQLRKFVEKWKICSKVIGDRSYNKLCLLFNPLPNKRLEKDPVLDKDRVDKGSEGVSQIVKERSDEKSVLAERGITYVNRLFANGLFGVKGVGDFDTTGYEENSGGMFRRGVKAIGWLWGGWGGERGESGGGGRRGKRSAEEELNDRPTKMPRVLMNDI